MVMELDFFKSGSLPLLFQNLPNVVHGIEGSMADAHDSKIKLQLFTSLEIVGNGLNGSM
jgi:hypothetical protein